MHLSVCTSILVLENLTTAKWARIVVYGPVGNTFLVVDVAAGDLFATFPGLEAFHAHRASFGGNHGSIDGWHVINQRVGRLDPMAWILRQRERLVQIKAHLNWAVNRQNSHENKRRDCCVRINQNLKRVMISRYRL